MQTKKIALFAVLIAMLLVQEQALAFIPNVQFSTLLILLFASSFKLRDSFVMIAVYVVIDSLYMGAFNLIYMVPMYIGWSLIPIGYHVFFKEKENTIALAFFGLFMGFIYGVIFMPFAVILTGVDPWAYLIADLPFQIVMAISNFLTILWLYPPLKKVYQQNLPLIN
jgi:hypothetical protein